MEFVICGIKELIINFIIFIASLVFSISLSSTFIFSFTLSKYPGNKLKSLSVLKEQSGIIILLLTKISSLIVPIILNADNEFLPKLLFSLVIFSPKS